MSEPVPVRPIILPCFDTEPHAPHSWTFFYTEPEVPAVCDGV